MTGKKTESEVECAHGVTRRCKRCYNREYYRQNREAVLAQQKSPGAVAKKRVRDRVLYARHREKKRQEKREHRAKHSDIYRERDKAKKNDPKYLARQRLNHAVYAGRVAKPSACPRCSAETPPNRMHGHHHDYSKPLEVEWMCSVCHGAEHRL